MKENKIIQERNLNGSMLELSSCHYVGSTGENALDQELLELAKRIAGEDKACLLAEMFVTAVRTSRGSISRANFKMMNRTLKEMRYANEVFHSYQHQRKVAVFGSARTNSEEAEYLSAVEFSQKMVEHDFMTITGAGPGIMAAGNEGAGRENSFGLNISLPFEASANAFIDADEKLIEFNYFFTRKLSFVKEADAAVAFPGGVGTMDEIFEALTLIQTGKASIYPIVLLDAPDGTYWKFWEQFLNEHLLRLGLISATDFHLFKVMDSVDDAIEEIVKFYRNFHSYRYVGDQLVIRLLKPLKDDDLEALNQEFSDIVKSGTIKQRKCLDAEKNEPELLELPRLVFRHCRKDFGRLRLLIDHINNFV